jgi:hypothetical protein
LLVSELRLGGDAPAEVLAEASEAGLTARIARADGEKCERCWHYETDIGEHPPPPHPLRALRGGAGELSRLSPATPRSSSPDRSR